MQLAPQHPFMQIRNISAGRGKMVHGKALASWLMNIFLARVFSAGPFEAQLGTFSQGRHKEPQKEVPDHFLFPSCLSSQFLIFVEILQEQCKPVLLKQLQGVCWL